MTSPRARAGGEFVEAFARNGSGNVRQKNHSSRKLAGSFGSSDIYAIYVRRKAREQRHDSFSSFFFHLPAHPARQPTRSFFQRARHTVHSRSFSFWRTPAICKPKCTPSVGSGMPHNRSSLILRARAAFEGHVLTYALNPFVAEIAWDE